MESRRKRAQRTAGFEPLTLKLGPKRANYHLHGIDVIVYSKLNFGIVVDDCQADGLIARFLESQN